MAPLPEIKTIRDMIWYQYAKIIAKSSFDHKDGKEAKKHSFGFIRKTFRQLQSGEKSWSNIMREDWQFVESDKVCIYCGCTEDLQREHIVPKSINIKPECKECERILGIHNQIWACKKCNGAGGKGTKGLYTFYKEKYPEERKFHDLIPMLVEKKYLKTIYCCHECNGTLDSTDLDNDGDITVLDIDCAIY